MFKMTSNEFKAAFQAHNEKKKEFRNQPRDILVGSEPGLNKISVNGKDKPKHGTEKVEKDHSKSAVREYFESNGLEV